MFMLKHVDLTRSEIALLFAATIPFWIFAGVSHEVVVNGELVSDFSLNFLGIVAGLALGKHAITEILRVISDRKKPVDERSLDPRKYSVERLALMTGLLLLGTAQLLLSTGIL